MINLKNKVCHDGDDHMTKQHLIISLADPPFDNLKGYIARHFVLPDEKMVESYIDDYSFIFSDQCF